MRKTETRDIGGLRYQVMQLGAIRGRAVMLRLTKVIGPAIAALMAAKPKGEGKGILDVDVAALGGIFEKLELTEADLEFFCQAFGEVSFVTLPDGKHPRVVDCFDDHFAGRYGDMLSWLAFSAEVNFGDFLSKASAAIPAESASPVPPGRATASA